jgi:glycosyltransferase involved in cell wall biosynthesis
MRIGFDAKRAYHNETGLGHYSRNLIRSLAEYYPEHEYFLFTPSFTERFETGDMPFIHPKTPGSLLSKAFPGLWRSRLILSDLKRNQIQLYHGLSHEIPTAISGTGIKTVVTIHDLIHERFPGQYSWFDRRMYSRKFRYACRHADRVVAVSQQTRQDIIDFYGISSDRVQVIYQSAHPRFEQPCTMDAISTIKDKFHLPSTYFLYVGSVIERKNLLRICQAMNRIKSDISIPLAVIGTGGRYKQEIKNYLFSQAMQDQVIWLSDGLSLTQADFPAIYQGALALLYPSLFEGFGIPILEALWSRLPVITSIGSCFTETAGEAAIYVDPESEEDIAKAIQKVYQDDALRARMKKEGLLQAEKFSPGRCAGQMMDLYNSLELEKA